MTDSWTDEPLVSCVMATGGRRRFVPQAIRCFQRQTYPSRELILVDDGDEPCDDLLPTDDERIHYLRLPQTTRLGRKLNLGIERARGSILQKLDDDDFYHPEFLSTMVKALPPEDEEPAIAALDRFVVLLAATGELRDSGSGWSAGPTLCFHRSVWERVPFRNAPRAVDQFFLQDAGVRCVKVRRPELLILVRHGGNHLWQRLGGRRVDEFFRRRPAYGKSLRELVSAADLRFYESLRARGPSRNERPVAMTSSSQPAARPPVSACLLSWKRPQNLPKIVEHLRRHDFIDEILVWNNDPGCDLQLDGDDVRVIDAPENLYCYGRFLCVREAKNAIVYVQDDDWLVDNVEALYRSFLADDSTLTHGLSEYHRRKRNRYRYPGHDLALLGWGAVFYRDWVSVLETEGIGAPNGSEDAGDPLFLREADKYFSLLLERPHRTLPARLRRLEDEGAVDIALHREGRHETLKALAIRSALAASRRRRSVSYPPTWHVVVTCHNYGRFLKTALESVLRSDADYVVTLVDDGSTDDSRQIGEAYAEQYEQISYLRNETPIGVTRARNLGIASRDSLFVVSLDADDRIGPNFLFEAEKLLRSGCDVANPDAILFGRTNDRWPVPDTVSFDMLLERNHVHCCAAFRRSYWVQVGGMDEDMTSWSDYEFWLRLASAGARIRRLAGDHFFYRKHGPSISARSHRLRDELQREIWRRHGRPRSRRARAGRR